MTIYTNTLIAYFAENGTPKEGLTPIVDIYQASDNTQVVTSESAIEIGGGGYKYFFEDADTDESYYYIFDGGASLLPGQRYAPGMIDHNSFEINTFLMPINQGCC